MITTLAGAVAVVGTVIPTVILPQPWSGYIHSDKFSLGRMSGIYCNHHRDMGQASLFILGGAYECIEMGTHNIFGLG
jgi:hypothetical protein